jgi:hypothetical protein
MSLKSSPRFEPVAQSCPDRPRPGVPASHAIDHDDRQSLAPITWWNDGATCGWRIACALRGPAILTSGATVPVTGWVPGAVKFNTALLLSRGDLLVVLERHPSPDIRVLRLLLFFARLLQWLWGCFNKIKGIGA